ncbi:hypothetical protein BASA81_006634 [Batrachochytrium salamandrivorans]|nr:hypothetical protein BASA81_006634 [Batrachochytrium salamandrivorans]
MNTAGCAWGRFTDEIFVYGTHCSQNTAAWLTVAILIGLGRVLLAIPHVANIHRKSKQRASLPHLNRARQVGMSIRSWLRIGTELLAGGTQFLFILLVSMNVASVRNGVSVVLFGVCLLPMVAGELMDLRVIYLLGKRILPFQQLGEQQQQQQGQTPPNNKHIKRKQWRNEFGVKAMTVLAVVAFGLCEISLLATSVGWPSSNNPLRAGLGLLAGYALFIGVVVTWQLHRCLHAVHLIKAKDDAQIKGAILKFQVLRAICAIFSLYFTTILLLLTFQVMELTWGVFLGALVAVEFCMQFSMIMVMCYPNPMLCSARNSRNLRSLERRTPASRMKSSSNYPNPEPGPPTQGTEQATLVIV